MGDLEKILILGYCLKPHALKGGLSLELFNTEESSLEAGKSYLFLPTSSKSNLPKEGKKYTLINISMGHRVIAYFDGIEDRTTLEKMIPFSIAVNRTDLPLQLEKGEFYLADLMQLPVFEFGTDKKIGFLKSFYHNNAQIVLVIERDDVGRIKGENINYELPFLDNFFPVIDLENKRIEIRIPEYVE